MAAENYTIAERRTAALATRKRLRAERTEAIMRNEPFNHSALAEVEQLLEGLDAAEREQELRRRAAARVAEAEGVAQAQGDVAGAQVAYLTAVGNAEGALDAFVSAVRQVRGAAADIAVHAGTIRPDINMGSEPLALDRVDRRISRYVAGALSHGLGGGQQFGDITLHHPNWITDWAAAESAAVNGLLTVLLRKPRAEAV